MSTTNPTQEVDLNAVGIAGSEETIEQPLNSAHNDPVEPTNFINVFAMTLAVGGPPIAVGYGAYYCVQNGIIDPFYIFLAIGFWFITGLGITVGFHRLLTHKSFETYRPIRAFFMFCGAMSVEGSPIVWCAVHRRHHLLSDNDGDPHSPHLHGSGIWGKIKGFFYGHCGWLFTGYWAHPNAKKYVPDLLSDPLLVAVDKLYYLWVIASILLPAGIGYLYEGTMWGFWMGMLWGGFIRVFFGHHFTWSVNSVCHMFGSREFRSNDLSTNNPVVALVAFGEGWHNNHHAFPSSARHGLHWWQFDTSWILIRSMQLVGLAWNVYVPPQKALDTKRIKA